MAVTFYLFTRPDKKGDHPIYTSIYLNGCRFCSSIGYSISPEKWDDEKMKVKHGASNARKVPFNTINSRIAAISSRFDTLEANNAKLSKEQIKKQLAEVVGRAAKESDTPEKYGPVNFFHYFDAFILDGKLNHKWALNTVKKWGTLRAHMKKFNPDITLDDFDKETLDAYVRFGATEIHMLDVSIRKELSLLRWYLGWCVDKGYTTNQTFSKYRARLKDTKKPVIFLEKDELLKLYGFKIPKNGTEVVLHDMDGEEYRKVVTEKASMDKVRDLFCFCCFTSLRYSDLAQLQRTNIQDGYIQLTTIKTDDTVNIPLNEQAQAILNKYAAFDFDGLALPVISNQKMNQYLKDICELCEFTTPVTIVQYIDGKRKDICQPKWKLMAVIMKMTGHSDYKAMKPYIEVAERTKDDAMVKFANFLK